MSAELRIHFSTDDLIELARENGHPVPAVVTEGRNAQSYATEAEGSENTEGLGPICGGITLVIDLEKNL